MVNKLLVGALLATGFAFSAQAQGDFDLGDFAKQAQEALGSLGGGQFAGLLDDEAKCGIEFATRIFADPAYQQCFNESFSIFGADGKIDCSKNPPQACMEFAKKADEIISPECKEFFAEDFEQDVAADVESWEEACKEFNAAGNSGADDNNIDIALDDAAQNAEDAANTVAADAQNNLDDAKDAIADATDGAFTVSTISFALAVFAALY